MIAPTLQKIGTFSGGLTSGNKVSFSLPLSGCYHAIYLRARVSAAAATDSQIASSIGDIEVVFGGTTIFKVPANISLALARMKSNVCAVDAGVIPLVPYTPNYEILPMRENLSWALNDISSATIYLNMTSSTITAVDVFADWDIYDKSPLGAYYGFSYQDFAISGNRFDTSTINTFGDGFAIRSHCVQLIGGTAPTLSNINLTLNGRPILQSVEPAIIAQSNGISQNWRISDNSGASNPFYIEMHYDGANVPAKSLIMNRTSAFNMNCDVGGTANPTGIRIFSGIIGGINSK